MMKIRRWLPKLPYLIPAAFLAYMAFFMISRGIRNEDWSFTLLAAGAFLVAVLLYITWPKDRLHFLNQWQTPDITTHKGIQLRAGLNSLIALTLVAAFGTLLWLTSNSIYVFAGVSSVLLLLHIPHSYWILRRQYEPLQTEDSTDDHRSLLRYKGVPQVRLWTRLLIGAIAGIGAVTGLQIADWLKGLGG